MYSFFLIHYIRYEAAFKLDLKTIYDDYSKMVYNLCLQYLQVQEDAEEVTQDVFVSVYQNLKEYRQEASPKTWIYRIAINKSLDFIRARDRQKRSVHKNQVEITTELHAPLSAWNHPGVSLTDGEELKKIMEAIYQLPSQQKSAIILCRIEQLPMKEAAEILGVSYKALESTLQRAKKNLENSLEFRRK